jgi:hypothetical protein
MLRGISNKFGAVIVGRGLRLDIWRGSEFMISSSRTLTKFTILPKDGVESCLPQAVVCFGALARLNFLERALDFVPVVCGYETICKGTHRLINLLIVIRYVSSWKGNINTVTMSG